MNFYDAYPTQEELMAEKTDEAESGTCMINTPARPVEQGTSSPPSLETVKPDTAKLSHLQSMMDALHTLQVSIEAAKNDDALTPRAGLDEAMYCTETLYMWLETWGLDVLQAQLPDPDA